MADFERVLNRWVGYVAPWITYDISTGQEVLSGCIFSGEHGDSSVWVEVERLKDLGGDLIERIKDDVKLKEEIKRFVYYRIWVRIGGPSLVSQELADFLFDVALNFGLELVFSAIGVLWRVRGIEVELKFVQWFNVKFNDPKVFAESLGLLKMCVSSEILNGVDGSETLDGSILSFIGNNFRFRDSVRLLNSTSAYSVK